MGKSVLFKGALALQRGIINSVLFSALIIFFAFFEAHGQDFSRATGGYNWSFPRDHGHHSGYQSEWWYFTGQLYADGAEPFVDQPLYGFQLTFFRRGVSESGSIKSEYMAHAAVTDLAAKRTFFSSRIGGGGLGISGASSASLRVWSGDWSVDQVGDTVFLRFGVSDPETKAVKILRGALVVSSKPWLQGRGGLSQKADCIGCASYYYSVPAMRGSVNLIDNQSESNLKALAWMDHEFMTNSLATHQVGWDWLGLMLKDGRSVMVFQVRGDLADNHHGNYMAGSIWNGLESRELSSKDFSFSPENLTSAQTWKSEVTGATYPTAWRLRIPSEGIDLLVRARVAKCEIGDFAGQRGLTSEQGMVYWEGPVSSEGEVASGYLEMTGYANKVRL